jgi:hypothetical protein
MIRLAVSVVLAVMATAALAERVPPVDADWQRHRNYAGKFSFDYPQSYFLPARPHGDTLVVIFAPADESASLTAFAADKAPEATPASMAAIYTAGEGIAVTALSEADGRVLVSGTRDGRVARLLVTTSGKKAVVIELWYPASAADPYEGIAERIFSSFKAEP